MRFRFLSDIIGAASAICRWIHSRYGSRAGFWRIHREFSQRGLPLTVFGVAMALARHPEIVAAIKAADYDVVSHGWRWIHYQHGYCRGARASAKAVQVLTDLFGKNPPAGIPAATALTPASWWWSTAALITTAIITAMIYLSGAEVACSDGSQRPH
ncbi:polysaccharide deacetylase family protein, partial [Klebsiella pneumoniae]|nr:polysaccharide deacetylase family protein [Klebsiella pneumoniae]